MYDDILLPTDGSDAADAAVDNALSLAAKYDATLHVLYVADTTEYSTVTFEDSVVDPLQREGEDVVDGVVERADAEGVAAKGVVMQGGVFETIKDYVADEGIDAIVMGTHGRRGLGRALLGSVTERVVRTSDVPVLTVRQTDTEAE
ncbi:universal stress protein [Halobacterium jilantaiense]|uniref:Nucleotide-binding universal stress protein, UspA family n=1 Tax=Halobacterium jilantaiense TaxID=355548 RepID=A0A1I0QSQ2_9EURY|nr:universal stress protein [Halobacterium jilantaiense]SEW30420.1 Nucleotide-binding universal stress protein, UspA family [Halobacterium jilantaiense]